LPFSAEAADRSAARARAISSLERESAGAARVTLDRRTGAARLLVVAPGSFELAGETARQKSQDFLERHGVAFGIEDAARDLFTERAFGDRFGGEHVAFGQQHRGVPVFGSELRVHFNALGELAAVNGTLVPDIQLDSVVPTVSAAGAGAIALTVVAKQHDDWNLDTAPPRLLVFRSGLVAGNPGSDHLVWEVEVGNGHDVREYLYVDAHRGFVVDQITGIEQIHRTIFHRNLGTRLWDEGDPLPYSGLGDVEDLEINSLIDFAEDTHQLFANLSEGTFLSYNGRDGVMRSIYQDENISCPNAWWTGSYTGFCSGTASDDVVAHEWTHAYTDGTHDLIYQWQPGALNESFSDIFGEIVDEINGVGSDTPHLLRTDDTCSDLMSNTGPPLTIESPPDIAGVLETGGARFNPLPPWTVQGQVELVDDGSGSPTDGCQELVGFTPGNVALVEFGPCLFRTPTERAQAAGAVGVIIVNLSNDGVITMPGDGPRLDIPAVMIGRTDGRAIRDALDLGVFATIDSSSSDSLRWIVAEDTLWSGLRDMWNPNCAGDPAKVSDSRYWCSTDDGGGVHTNSGVPNHAFALVVDGGSYNGHTVAGIGMTKAAHIWWRAMSVYQTPISEFVAHADLIELSCQDLVGNPLTDLTTGGPSGEVISSFDCDQVAEGMLAVEMRDLPVQCRFDLILDPDAPDLPRYPVELFAETFDTELGAEWAVSNQGVDPEDYIPRDWVWTSEPPAGASGGAVFATNDPMGGNCGFNDQSAVMHLDSPLLTVPAGGVPVAVFDHYVATEPGGDGGNLKVSVNGGPFELVPASAYLFNGYNRTLDGPERSRNPIAGEPAYSGLNEASFRGSWGQSQVSLAGIARAGDTLRLRFDFGVDGCAGWDGWYLDSVRVLLAEAVVRGGPRLQP
jgi:Zn-dependent metalloprotease